MPNFSIFAMKKKPIGNIATQLVKFKNLCHEVEELAKNGTFVFLEEEYESLLRELNDLKILRTAVIMYFGDYPAHYQRWAKRIINQQIKRRCY